MVEIKFGDYTQEGLYLILKDSRRLDLTKNNIEETAKKFWGDPSKISPAVKEAAEFKRCDFCPLIKMGGLCNAIRPILPLLESLDKFVSYDKIFAIYKGEQNDLLHTADTDMQQALRYIAILNLIHYCQNGQKYKKYFHGIMPLQELQEIAIRFYLNIYWLHNGDEKAITDFTAKFKEELTITSKNQIKRINLICKNDALKNAIVNTQIIPEFLSLDMRKTLKTAFDNIEKS
jgi:hypothetical protein